MTAPKKFVWVPGGSCDKNGNQLGKAVFVVSPRECPSAPLNRLFTEEEFNKWHQKILADDLEEMRVSLRS